jgi:hypothetical protein
MKKKLKEYIKDKSWKNINNFHDNSSNLQKTLNIPISNPIMLYLEKFNEYFKKKKRKLKIWEVLFSPWINEYFYIITSWILAINSYTKDWEKKEVAKAYSWNFIWEWVICGRSYKNVEAIAITETEVFSLTENDLKEFEKDNQNEALDIYKHIIDLTNKRLVDSSNELWTIYEINEKIIELSKLWEKWFDKIITKIKNIMWFDYIIYIEHHPIIQGLLYYKYNTRFPSVYPVNTKTWNEINCNTEGKITWNDNILWVSKNDSTYVIKLKNKDNLKWFFVLWKTQWIINDNEIRILNNLSNLLWYIIDSNQKISEEKAKKIKESIL